MEYRIGKGAKILYFLLASFCLLIGGALFMYALEEGGFGERMAEIVGSLLIILLGIVVIRHVHRFSLTVDNDSITIKTAFSVKTILLSDIDGYRRINGGYRWSKDHLFIVLKNGGRRIRVPQALEGRPELFRWLADNYPDIDLRENGKELELLLENGQFGVSRQARMARLRSAQHFEKYSGITGLVLCFWSLFESQPYELVMIVLFVMPWAAAAVTWYYKGLIKLYKRKSSPYPSMVPVMFFTICSAWVSVLRDYELYEFENRTWLFFAGGAILAAVICVFLCWRGIVTSRRKLLTYSCIFLFAGVYSYSLLIFSNCYYDRSKPDIYPVEVRGKRMSSGSSASYYLEFSAWGPYNKGKQVEVPRSFYEGVRESDRVNVVSMKGRWEMGWFWLER